MKEQMAGVRVTDRTDHSEERRGTQEGRTGEDTVVLVDSWKLRENGAKAQTQGTCTRGTSCDGGGC